MTSYTFLTPEWIDAARALRNEYAGRTPPPPIETRINVVVTDVPHADDQTLKGHIDTTSGQAVIEEGHVDKPDLTVTVDYATARAAFVTRDAEALMAAFFAGKILVEGDATVLMALQGAPVDGQEDLAEMYRRLEAITI